MIAGGLSALLAAGCNKAEPLPVAKLSPAQEEQAKLAVRSTLKDPHSAMFEGLEAGTTHDGTIVCGYVNAKNGFGGYVGRQPFRVLLYTAAKKPEVLAVGESGGYGGVVLAKCREYGLLKT